MLCWPNRAQAFLGLIPHCHSWCQEKKLIFWWCVCSFQRNQFLEAESVEMEKERNQIRSDMLFSKFIFFSCLLKSFLCLLLCSFLLSFPFGLILFSYERVTQAANLVLHLLVEIRLHIHLSANHPMWHGRYDNWFIKWRRATKRWYLSVCTEVTVAKIILSTSSIKIHHKKKTQGYTNNIKINLWPCCCVK